MHKSFSWWCPFNFMQWLYFFLCRHRCYSCPVALRSSFMWMLFLIDDFFIFLASVSIPIRCRIRLVSFHVGNVFLTFTQFLLNVAVSKEAWLLLSFYKNLYQSSLSGFWCFIVSSIYCFVLLLQFSFFVFQLDIVTILFSLSLHFS